MAGSGMQHRRVQEEDDGTSDWPDRRNPVVHNVDSDSQYESDGSENQGDLHGACVWNHYKKPVFLGSFYGNE